MTRIGHGSPRASASPGDDTLRCSTLRDEWRERESALHGGCPARSLSLVPQSLSVRVERVEHPAEGVDAPAGSDSQCGFRPRQRFDKPATTGERERGRPSTPRPTRFLRREPTCPTRPVPLTADRALTRRGPRRRMANSTTRSDHVIGERLGWLGRTGIITTASAMTVSATLIPLCYYC